MNTIPALLIVIGTSLAQWHGNNDNYSSNTESSPNIMLATFLA